MQKLVALVLALSTSLVAAHAVPNMVTNPGFEDGANGWSLPAQLYAIDGNTAHSGAHSLRYHNEPGGPYLLASQSLPLKSGKCYRMSVWVKTDKVVCDDTGATICMEWFGKDGYIGGSYPPGIKGTNDWQRIDYVTCVVPPGVTGGSVTVYGRSGATGTAWFDDVEVTELPGPAARFGFAGRPAMQRTANVFSETDTPQVGISAELLPDSGFATSDLVLSAVAQPPGWQKEFRSEAWQGDTVTVGVPTAPLPYTETPVQVDLVSKATGRPVTGDILTITRLNPLRLDIVQPNSAGAIVAGPGSDQDIVARVVVTALDPTRPTTYRARLRLISEGKPDGRSVETAVTDAKPAIVRLPTAALGYGLHALRCELFGSASGRPIAVVEAAVTKADPAQRPANATCLGPNRMLMVGGKPFFPMGFYILSSFQTVFPADKPYNWVTGKLYPEYYLPILDRLSKSHFNCVMDYGSTMGGMQEAREFMDACQQRGVRTIFSVKDLMKGACWEAYTRNLPWKDLGEATRNVVEALRQHPSLIGWYINDEVIQPELWQGAVDVFHNVRATDPWHPTWAVHYDCKGIARYRTACDAIGTDPYSLCGDIGAAARSWHEARQAMPPEQPLWAVVQCFGSGYEMSNPADKREPTYDEERAATFAAIAEGSTGIIYYCYHSLQRSPRFEERFAELDRIAAEVQGMAPVISLPDAAKPAQVEKGTLSVLTKQGQGKMYVLLASTVRSDQDVVLRLPFRAKTAIDAKTGESLPVNAGRLALRFKALDARLVEVR
jgi:hypothetical protein